jgi:hypothetical protein
LLGCMPDRSVIRGIEKGFCETGCMTEGKKVLIARVADLNGQVF